MHTTEHIRARAHTQTQTTPLGCLLNHNCISLWNISKKKSAHVLNQWSWSGFSQNEIKYSKAKLCPCELLHCWFVHQLLLSLYNTAYYTKHKHTYYNWPILYINRCYSLNSHIVCFDCIVLYCTAIIASNWHTNQQRKACAFQHNSSQSLYSLLGIIKLSFFETVRWSGILCSFWFATFDFQNFRCYS